jgi:hypothetical protein
VAADTVVFKAVGMRENCWVSTVQESCIVTPGVSVQLHCFGNAARHMREAACCSGRQSCFLQQLAQWQAAPVGLCALQSLLDTLHPTTLAVNMISTVTLLCQCPSIATCFEQWFVHQVLCRLLGV